MICKHCRAEVADTALICFRCGEATEEAVHQPPAEQRVNGRRAVAPLLLGLLFLAVALYFVWRRVFGEPVAPMVWVMLAAAGVLLAVRLARR